MPPDASTTCCSSQLWETLHDSIRSLTQAASSSTALQSVKNLLEAGDVVSALPILHFHLYQYS